MWYYVYVHLIICVYSLKPPSNSEVVKYVEKVFDEIYNKDIDKDKIIAKFLEKFENIAEDTPISTRWKPACCIFQRKLFGSLELRRKLVGELLKVVRSISQHTFSEETFEEGTHTVSSEPYFRETSYKSPVLKEVTVIEWKNKCLVTESRLPNDEHECSLDEIPIAVDIDSRCHLNMDDEEQFKSWKCNVTCKTLSNEDRQIIVDLKNNFSDDSMEDVRDVLDSLDDGCQHGHYYKFFDGLVHTKENWMNRST